MGWRPSTRLDVKAGSAIDAWSADIPFDYQTRLISSECWDENLNMRLSSDGGATYNDPFEVDIDRPFIFPFSASDIQVQNKTPGSTTRYQAAAGD